VAYAAAPLDFGEALNKLRSYIYSHASLSACGVHPVGPAGVRPNIAVDILREYTPARERGLAMAAC